LLYEWWKESGGVLDKECRAERLAMDKLSKKKMAGARIAKLKKESYFKVDQTRGGRKTLSRSTIKGG